MPTDDPYELVWDTSVFQELLTILGNMPRRADAVRAMQLVESTLPHRPRNQGVHLHEGLWQFDAQALIFFY